MRVMMCPNCGQRMTYRPDRERDVGIADDDTGLPVIILEARHWECDCGRVIMDNGRNYSGEGMNDGRSKVVDNRR